MCNLPEMRAANTAFWLAVRTKAERLGVAATPASVRATLSHAPVRVGSAPEWAEALAGLRLQGIAPAAMAGYGVPCAYAAEAAAFGCPVLC